MRKVTLHCLCGARVDVEGTLATAKSYVNFAPPIGWDLGFKKINNEDPNADLRSALDELRANNDRLEEMCEAATNGRNVRALCPDCAPAK